MSEPLIFPANPSDEEMARMYRLQVREMEDVAMFLTTPEGRITSWNVGVEKVFGYTEQEWLGQHFNIIFNEEDRAAGVHDGEMQVATEQGRCVDVRWHRRKDGSRVYMTGVLKGLRDEKGTLLGYSKVFLDDTARKRLEDALTQSNRDLQQFAYVASHDLQEPLRTLSSFAELLRLRYRENFDQQAQQFLGFIIDASTRMGALISDLLAFSQLAHEEGGGGVSVHLDDDLEAAVTLLKASLDQSGGTITHDPLPNIDLERNQMVRLFQNLLGNSVKFRRREVPPRIHVSADRQGKEWIIRIEDNGIGFPPEQAESIFAPFKRLHSREDYAGSGIGLAACKRIVESYGGRIGAEGRPGEGATFWFTIPVSAADQKSFGSHGFPSG